MTRADRLAIAKYLRSVARELHDTYYVYGGPRPEPLPQTIRDDIAQLRKWAKMLREDK